MEIDFLIEDDAWLAVPEREALARRAIPAIFEVLERPVPQAELSIVFTSDAAVAELNRMWRGKPQPTNVLSFPAAAGPGRAPGAPQPGVPQPLGDIVLAAGVVSAEASAQGKPLANHTTHLIVHGVLHLLGFDHVDEAHAEAMERLETEVMTRLGLPDPYEDAQAPGRLQATRAVG
jgi:probable rRNA maturation factor